MAPQCTGFPLSSSVHPMAVEQHLRLGIPSRSLHSHPFKSIPCSSAFSRDLSRNVQHENLRKGRRRCARAEHEDGMHCQISKDNFSLSESPSEDEGDPQSLTKRLPMTSYTAFSHRRSILIGIVAFSGLSYNLGIARAVKQTLLAGRIPGLSPPDENGLRTYRRPEAKSGGHGVGWSPIIPYTFKVPEEWEEVPVSIADLGGAEIDLRFSNKQEGNLSIVVAPVLRFASDLGDDAKIEKVGPPEKVIDAFGPELVGQNVEGQVKDMKIVEHNGRKYYLYELNVPHVLISVTAAGNRLYLMTVSGNARQWKKHGEELKQIAGSFRVG